MKACPRCTRPYSPLDLYCGSCGTIRCADNVPKLLRRFEVELRESYNEANRWFVNDRRLPYHMSYVATFCELEHAETFRNCLIALELGKIEDAS